MTTAYWCILAAALLPYFTVAPAKARRDFNNNAPREWEGRLDGWRARLYWAHLNGFEAFPPFAAAVIVAHLAHAPQARIDALAVVFVAARVAYGACYYADRASLRSVVWSIGFLCVAGLFAVAALGQ
jgi:uncharacterized MAPEG superfamily protein